MEGGTLMLFTLPRLGGDALGGLLYGRGPRLIAPGVYEPGFAFNFSADLEASGYKIGEYPFDPLVAIKFGTPEWDAAVQSMMSEDNPADYGVCDSWRQIVERWPIIVESERRFVIGVTRVRRVDQSPEGGWRWHKWGFYIGTHEPQREYLYDEEGIEQVWCFHIYEILGGVEG
jgi:hypothetical protein